MTAFRFSKKWSWVLPLAGRLFLGGIFVASGYAKLTEPIENFSGLLAEYTILPPAFIPLLAHAVPWIEFVAGTFLVLGFLPKVSVLALVFLSCNFLIVLGLSKIMLGVLPTTCGCFGEGGLHLSVTQVMFLDFFDVALGFWLLNQEKQPWSLDTFLKEKQLS